MNSGCKIIIDHYWVSPMFDTGKEELWVVERIPGKTDAVS
jgi:hypothetical protein